MQFEQWDNRFRTLRTNTSILFITNAILVVLLGISLYFNSQQKTIVVVQPMVANDKVEIRENSLQNSYGTAFGLSMALLLGNINANNMPYVLQSISSYVSPTYFATFRKTLVANIEKLKENRLDITFTPTNTFIENGEVVVNGFSSIIDATGLKRTQPHQFRFLLDMKNYLPLIINIESISFKNPGEL